MDVKDLNALSSIFLTREDLLYCTQLLQGIIKRFKDKTDAIGNNPQYLMPMPGYPFLMVLNNEGAKKNCEAAKEAAASILATPCPSNYPLAAAYLSYCDAVQPDCRTGDCPSVCPGDILENMEILPSGETGHNMDGGRFGEKVRKEKNKEGKLVDRDHWGTDFKADIGTPVYAMHDGMVDFSGFKPKQTDCYVDKTDNICKGSWGNYVQITSTIDGQKVQMLYAHFSELGVNAKQNIKQGDLLGYSGNTGNAQSDGVKPHLHVEA